MAQMEEHWPQKMAEMVMNVDKSGECFLSAVTMMN